MKFWGWFGRMDAHNGMGHHRLSGLEMQRMKGLYYLPRSPPMESRLSWYGVRLVRWSSPSRPVSPYSQAIRCPAFVSVPGFLAFRERQPHSSLRADGIQYDTCIH